VQFFFENHRLDVERRELRRGPDLVALEPQVFDLLVYLVQNRDRVVSKDDLIASVWGGRIVSDSTLTSRINAVRKAVGDSGEQQKLIRTIARKGIRFVAAVDEPANPGAKPRSASSPSPRQDIHFCKGFDGVRIAYASVGQGLPLLKASNWLSHLEYDWESPVWSHLFRALAAEYRLIRYDQRGNGLSDWDIADMSFEAFVNDIESVVQATGLQRFALFGISQGARTSLAYALRHPERVSHLVLYGGAARGRRRTGSAREIELSDALVALMRLGWGQDNPAFRQTFTTRFMPDATIEQMRWFNELQRISTSPENAVRIRNTMDNADISDAISQIQVPTLVLHCRNDGATPFEEGRRMAAGIPGARFVALEGNNHLVLEGEPARERLLEEMRNFLKS
jgi:pimeloyl-ACP methyl ester carboxylesterase/DNA-binding winged helix-turn-helix (wHTH) protein